MKLRFHPKSFGIFLSVLLVEIGIALYVRDAFIRPFVGDVLVVVLMFYALACVLQTNLRKLMWGVLAFAFFVEILQYFHIRDVLHLQNRALRVMVGGTFDFMDFLGGGMAQRAP
jgi:DNA integrity scanning protein DisA with diadenylate cyclase activity